MTEIKNSVLREEEDHCVNTIVDNSDNENDPQNSSEDRLTDEDPFELIDPLSSSESSLSPDDLSPTAMHSSISAASAVSEKDETQAEDEYLSGSASDKMVMNNLHLSTADNESKQQDAAEPSSIALASHELPSSPESNASPALLSSLTVSSFLSSLLCRETLTRLFSLPSFVCLLILLSFIAGQRLSVQERESTSADSQLLLVQLLAKVESLTVQVNKMSQAQQILLERSEILLQTEREQVKGEPNDTLDEHDPHAHHPGSAPEPALWWRSRVRSANARTENDNKEKTDQPKTWWKPREASSSSPSPSSKRDRDLFDPFVKSFSGAFDHIAHRLSKKMTRLIDRMSMHFKL